MSTLFTFTPLSESVYFIQWHGIPNKEEGQAFISQLKQLLDDSPAPLYFMTDLRNGHIADNSTIRALGKLTQHANFGGSTAMGGNSRNIGAVGLFSINAGK
jgi:hypothetical protein